MKRLYIYGTKSLIGISVDTEENRSYYSSRGFVVSDKILVERSVTKKVWEKKK